MSFALNWTGHNPDRDESAEKIAAEVARETCAQFGFDPASAYAEHCASESGARAWEAIEMAAINAAFEGWHSFPENVSLIWRD